MRKRFWLIVITLFLMLTISACSGTEHKLLTEDSSPSRDNALMVMGIKWVEDYNDTKTKEDKTMISYDLVKNEEEVEKKRIDEGKPELYKPLYYMNSFVFSWTDDKGKESTFTRFGEDLRQYENIAIYEFPPGKYSLNQIEMRQYRFEIDNLKGVEYRKKFKSHIKENLGTWELPAGKIVYLGDLIFHFKTERYIFGLLTPKEVVKSIKLVDIKIENKFDEMKEAIKEQKPWFPVDQIDNIATENRWEYSVEEVKESTETPKEKKETEKKDTEKKKTEKKNTFY